ncbi:MAG: T9SS type A sorting domain-containing protein [Bacteroidales bacterium]|nr:T9SS type A sorting domain-containing protein [Bacteroidales bacterium]MCF8343148.1 T9SS type A sorting domain-containing protein [Bacteroidales bacterium]MCF8350358.1 T9SS type A sorting domain-containing protein [Bacteroidales bacterium]MCF8376490.1 T9SS type A sorting domain-containing protein [Bacteroidales bacterium]MCF8401492.1 T9SS type A sorting domain-containing protein [Bacteroidales bacterium]
MKSIFLLFLLAFAPVYLSGQHTNILIDDDQSGYKACEPSIIINPKNTDHMVAGAVLDRVYYSTNGGYSWNVDRLTSPWGVWGDPTITVDTSGAYYYLHLANPPAGQGSWIDRIISQKTETIEGEWDQVSYMGLNGTKNQDKQWPVVDRTNNNIYVTWSQFDEYGSSDTSDKSDIRFSKSTDGGASWSEAISINEVPGDCIDSDNTVEGAVPAVGPNGEIYVSWSGPEGLVFDRSTDQGENWLDEDIFVSDLPGGWDYSIPGISRCNGFPVTKCDLSEGPYHGTIYINWSDQRKGIDDTDVWLAKSTDGGNSWTGPVRVNDDPPGKHQFFTWMDVDQATGYLWFVWYDRRNYTDNNTDVYMAVSRDGGESFINFKVSESPFLPGTSAFFGDYNNVSAHNDVVRPVWTRMHEGQLGIWTAIVDPLIVDIQNNIPELFSLEQNFPNPFRESTFIKFKLYEPGEISLYVSDIHGRKIAYIYDREYLERGKYVEHFNVEKQNPGPGVYFITLQQRDKVIKRKMIISD